MAAPNLAVKELTPEDKALETDLIDSFQSGTLITMQVQCSLQLKAVPAYVKSPQNKVVHEIAATMGMMSKTLTGAVALGFKQDVFLKIIGKMLGETYTEITTEVEDGCGELLNIIFGQAKKVLNDKGHKFGKTLPSIFVGTSLRVRQLTPSPTIILPFDSEAGLFHVEIGYRHVTTGLAIVK